MFVKTDFNPIHPPPPPRCQTIVCIFQALTKYLYRFRDSIFFVLLYYQTNETFFLKNLDKNLNLKELDQDTNGCDLCEELLLGDFFRFFSALGPLPKVVSLAPGCRMPTCAKQSMLILRRLLLSIVFSHSILFSGSVGGSGGAF